MRRRRAARRARCGPPASPVHARHGRHGVPATGAASTLGWGHVRHHGAWSRRRPVGRDPDARRARLRGRPAPAVRRSPRRAARRPAPAARAAGRRRQPGLPAGDGGDPRRRLAGRAGARRPAGPPCRDHRADRAQDDRSTRSTRAPRSGSPTWRTRTPRTGSTWSAVRSTCTTRCAARSPSPRPRARTTRCATADAIPVIVPRPRGWHLDERAPARRRRAGGRRAGRLRAVLLPQRPRAARPRQRAVLLPAEAGVPPRGAAVERRLHARPERRWRCRTGSSARRSSSRRSPRRSRWRRSCTRCATTSPGSTRVAGTTCSASSRTSATPARRTPSPTAARSP